MMWFRVSALLFTMISPSACDHPWVVGFRAWQCHHYYYKVPPLTNGKCREVSGTVFNGWEFNFTRGKDNPPGTNPCWCIKRHAEEQAIPVLVGKVPIPVSHAGLAPAPYFRVNQGNGFGYALQKDYPYAMHFRTCLVFTDTGDSTSQLKFRLRDFNGTKTLYEGQYDTLGVSGAMSANRCDATRTNLSWVQCDYDSGELCSLDHYHTQGGKSSTLFAFELELYASTEKWDWQEYFGRFDAPVRFDEMVISSTSWTRFTRSQSIFFNVIDAYPDASEYRGCLGFTMAGANVPLKVRLRHNTTNVVYFEDSFFSGAMAAGNIYYKCGTRNSLSGVACFSDVTNPEPCTLEIQSGSGAASVWIYAYYFEFTGADNPLYSRWGTWDIPLTGSGTYTARADGQWTNVSPKDRFGISYPDRDPMTEIRHCVTFEDDAASGQFLEARWKRNSQSGGGPVMRLDDFGFVGSNIAVKKCKEWTTQIDCGLGWNDVCEYDLNHNSSVQVTVYRAELETRQVTTTTTTTKSSSTSTKTTDTTSTSTATTATTSTSTDTTATNTTTTSSLTSLTSTTSTATTATTSSTTSSTSTLSSTTTTTSSTTTVSSTTSSTSSFSSTTSSTTSMTSSTTTVSSTTSSTMTSSTTSMTSSTTSATTSSTTSLSSTTTTNSTTSSTLTTSTTVFVKAQKLAVGNEDGLASMNIIVLAVVVGILLCSVCCVCLLVIARRRVRRDKDLANEANFALPEDLSQEDLFTLSAVGPNPGDDILCTTTMGHTNILRGCCAAV